MSISPTDATEVLIVGAGPTGLVLALWLTRLGVPVRIIDKTAEAGTTSRALAVAARTLELYHQVGIADAVIAGGVKVECGNLWVSGGRIARIWLRNLGAGRDGLGALLCGRCGGAGTGRRQGAARRSRGRRSAARLSHSGRGTHASRRQRARSSAGTHARHADVR